MKIISNLVMDVCSMCLQGFRSRLVSGESDFAGLAAQESHCSSARRGGDLGEFG